MSGFTSEPGPQAPGAAVDGHGEVLGPVIVTDLELAVLEAAHRRLIGEPEPSSPREEGAGTDGDEREARRSLVARGLLDENGGLPEDDVVALLVPTLLDVRLAAQRVLVVERIMAGAAPEGGVAPGSGRRTRSTDRDVRRGIRLVHLVGSGACVEDLLADGSHHLYLLLDRDDVVPWVTGVTVPPDATAGTGPALVVDPDRPEQIAMLLGHPTVLAALSVLGSADEAVDAVHDRTASPAHHLLALGPSGCWVTRVEPGRSLPESVVLRPVNPCWVGEWTRSVMDEGPTAGRREVGGGQGTMAG